MRPGCIQKRTEAATRSPTRRRVPGRTGQYVEEDTHKWVPGGDNKGEQMKAAWYETSWASTGNIMKGKLIIVFIFLLAVSLGAPSLSHARGHFYGRHYGWYGGPFLGGVVVGSAIARPWYYGPPPVYVYPAPSVVYGAPAPAPAYAYPPDEAYAYPDPTYRSGAGSEQPHGELVTVPGQWVGGKWIPSHRAWVPLR